MDSAFVPKDPLRSLDTYLPSDMEMALFRHPRRDNPRQEISALTHTERKMLTHDQAVSAERFWQEKNFPYNDVPMHIGGVLFRRNTPTVRAFGRIWYPEKLGGYSANTEPPRTNRRKTETPWCGPKP